MARRLFFVILLFVTLILSACGETIDDIFTSLEMADDQHAIAEVIMPDGELEVHFIDVGQGDAILMRSSEATVLVDAGDWTGKEVVPYLESQGIETIDVAIGTHEHADHIGQLDSVIENFNVEEVWLPGNEHTSQTYERVLSSIEDYGVTYHEPRAGEIYDVEDIVLEVFNPSTLTGNYNDDSIVVKASYGDVSFMLTGDAEKRAEKNMLESGQDLSATFLKVGHHGSNTSSMEDFVQAVNPEYAIMSYGKNNSYYHPHKQTLDTFEHLGVEMYGTDPHGTIVVWTDGESYHIDYEKDGHVTQGGD